MTLYEQEKQLAKQVQAYLRVASPVSNAVSLVKRNTSRCFIFGGALRDIIRPDKVTRSLRDVDCVVARRDLRRLEVNCSPYVQGRNRFGGLRLRVSGVPVDVWAVEDTWAFRKQLVAPFSFYALTRTTFLNIDGIVAEISTGESADIKIFAKDFLNAFSKKVLEITLSDNPFPLLVALKALRAAYRYDLRISYSLALYLFSTFSSYRLSQIEREQLRHYRRVIFDESHLASLAGRFHEYLARNESSKTIAFAPNDQLCLPGWEEEEYDRFPRSR